MTRLIRANVEVMVPDDKVKGLLDKGFALVEEDKSNSSSDVAIDTPKQDTMTADNKGKQEDKPGTDDTGNTDKSIEDMTVKELQDAAKAIGLSGISNLSKDDLIAVIKKQQSNE